jgi:hypothetical protein
VDVVASNFDGSRLLALQVKTARWAHRPKRYGHELREWDVSARSVGRFSETLWYAFVDLQERVPERSPKVFFVPSRWVGSFVKQEWDRKMFLLRSELWPLCEERWDRIEAFLRGDPETRAWSEVIPLEATDWRIEPA